MNLYDELQAVLRAPWCGTTERTDDLLIDQQHIQQTIAAIKKQDEQDIEKIKGELLW